MHTSRLLLLVTVLMGAASVFASELTVFVSPDGNDNLQGGSETEAVATLQRALKLAEAASDNELTQVSIALKTGIYKAQNAITRGHPQGATIVITGVASNRVVFDGDGKGGTWLTLKPHGGQPSNLKIVGLEIANYETAINVVGNRNNPQMWAGGMEVRNNRFNKIGNIALAGAAPSTAAIRLVNSDKNIFAGNTFSNIRNDRQCGLLHALYIAHGSTDNVIEDNLFEDSCGDAVRFRDRSDNNLVRNNIFIDAWSQSPISDWFCNPKQRKNCTKAKGECPSTNLQLVGNKVMANGKAPLSLFMHYGGTAPVVCNIPQGAQRAIIQ